MDTGARAPGPERNNREEGAIIVLTEYIRFYFTEVLGLGAPW